jgi:chitinase
MQPTSWIELNMYGNFSGFVKSAFLLLLVTAGSCNKNQIVARSGSDDLYKNFRVIGYLPLRENPVADVNTIDFSKITHLNLAFINPDSLGTLQKTENLKAIAAIAHAKNVKVMASIGGGSGPVFYHALLMPDKQPKLVAEIVKLCVDHGLDGIDVDLEGDLIDANYEDFVINLAAALRQNGKMITAAIATAYKDDFTDKALAQFDFVNIMSYDQTGPWNLSKPGPHAPFEMAEQDVDYWNRTRGIAKEKLSVGVPFYGYGFGGKAPESMSFKNILAQFPGSESKDQLEVSGGMLYYNGVPTIKRKTELALEKAGGVMIWQLLQDASDQNSLLGTIDSVIQSKKK